MNEFLTVLTAVLPVFGIRGIGLWLRERNHLSADADASLMRGTIHLPPPSLIFASVLGNAAQRRPENLPPPPLAGFGMAVAGVAVAGAFARLAGLRTKPFGPRRLEAGHALSAGGPAAAGKTRPLERIAPN